MFPNVSDAVRATVQVANVHTPNPRNVEIYNELFGEYRALYSALKDRYANLYHTMEKIKCMSM
jgi:sugar (pentulose or hexulose) kinase